MKMRLGRNRDYDCELLDTVRGSIGPRRRLMVDGSALQSLDEARRMIQCFKEMEVFWLEEPFAPEELDSSIVLQPARGSIPLAAAENELGLRERMDSCAVQVV